MHHSQSYRTSLIERLDASNEWVIVLQENSTVSLKCFELEEFQRLLGSYLVQLSQNCPVTIGNQKSINEQEVKTVYQSIILLDLNIDLSTSPKDNASWTMFRFSVKQFHLRPICHHLMDQCNKPVIISHFVSIRLPYLSVLVL